MYLSVIIPIYNAAPFLAKSLARLNAYLSEFGKPAELILINDSSADNSGEIIADFERQERGYKVVHLSNSKNMGKGFSVAKAMLAATGKYRIFTDCDLAYPPSEIGKILASLESGFDAAIACRVDKNSRYTISPAFFRYLYTRHLASRFFNFLLRTLLLPLCRDSQAGLKGFTAAAAQKIFGRQKIRGFSFDIETLFLANQFGLSVKEVAIDFSYFDEPTTIKFAKDSLGVITDILRIKLWGWLKQYEIPASPRSLIINADDFGLSEKVSAGIAEACRDGIVNSLSIIPNTADFEKSLKLLDGIDANTGIHFTLSHGKPLSNNVSSLVGQNGYFHPLKTLHIRSFFGLLREEDIEKELSAQLARVREKIPRISHIDSHHHVHILPKVRDVVARLATENGIRYVRSPYSGNFTPKGFLVSLFKGARPEFWRSRGIKTSDNFFGFNLGGRKDLLKKWQRLLKNLPCGVTEIMVHPGLLDEATGDCYKNGRVIELEVLKDPSLKELCKLPLR